MSFQRSIRVWPLTLLLFLLACQPQTIVETVEVTRMVENTVVETRVIEVAGEEVAVEVTRVVEPTAVPVPQGGHVIYSNFADANTFNPVLGNDQASSDVYSLMFLGLTQLDPFSGSIVGDLAESWDISEDGLTYTFHLRPDAVWSDGTPVTAQDVVFTFDAINNDAVASPRRGDFASVASWAVVDDQTVEVTMSALDCTILANIGTGIIPAHVYGSDPEAIPENPENTAPTVVSGPFQFQEWVADDHVTLAANPTYFRGAPNVATWTMKVYADQSAELAGLLAGEATYTSPVGPAFVSVIEGQIASGAPMSMRKYFDNGFTFLGYNLANPENPQNGWDDLDGDGKYTEGEPPLPQDPHPILGDLAVRQAIANSIDYQGIINQVAFGQGGPIVANVWPSIEWAYNTELEPYTQDLDKARQILDDAGWVDSDGDGVREKDGKRLSLSLMTNAGNEKRENIGVLLKDVLAQVGIEIQLDFLEFGTVVQRLVGQTYDMIVIGFGGGAPDPDDTNLFSYINDEPGAGFNFASYYSPVVEENLAKGKAIPGCAEAERAPYYHSNQVEIYNDLPASFLHVDLENTVWWNNLEGIDPNVWSREYNVQEWYFTN